MFIVAKEIHGHQFSCRNWINLPASQCSALSGDTGRDIQLHTLIVTQPSVWTDIWHGNSVFYFLATLVGGVWFLFPLCSHSLNPLCLMQVQNLSERPKVPWRSKDWPPDHKATGSYLHTLLEKMQVKGKKRALNKSILSRRSEGKWSLNQNCHSSAGPHTRCIAITPRMKDVLPAGDSSTGSASHISNVCKYISCCIHTWSDVYVHNGSYVKRSDSEVCTRDSVTWHWSTARDQ